jgi:hypothetical protein
MGAGFGAGAGEVGVGEVLVGDLLPPPPVAPPPPPKPPVDGAVVGSAALPEAWMFKALPQRIAAVMEAKRHWVILDVCFIGFLIFVFVSIASAHRVFFTGMLNNDNCP